MAKKESTFEKLAPVFVFISIVLAFAVGVLWQKVAGLEGGSSTTKTTATNPAAAGNAGNTAPSAPTQGKLSADQAAKLPPVTKDDRIRGSLDADVFLVEYSDFQCPYCGRFHPTANQVMDEYGDKVAWVYRHFPLDSIHPQARPAANASECIYNLGGNDAFWKFADTAFADQTKLDDLSALAVAAGVNKGSFESCLTAKKFESIVDEQYQGGLTAGVTGTPGNFVVNKNGDVWLIPGAQPFESVKATIDEALGA